VSSPDIYPISGFSEPVSSLTHLLGAGTFTVLGVLLLRRGRGDWLRVMFLGVYAFACVFLLSMSGVYHLLAPNGAGRAVLARLDHGAIFVLIAGSFTPAHGLLFQGWGRWGTLLLIWATAVSGITLKTIFFTDTEEWLGLLFYLVLGWLGVVSGVLLWRRHGYRFIRPLLWGGVAYTMGGILDFVRWPIVVPGVFGPHEAFHVAVLAGALLHWRFVWSFASGDGPSGNGGAPGESR
jgi:channel protein (hemolysin III family)